MDARESLMYRIAFAGLPLGELQQILRRVDEGRDWTAACLISARTFRRLAARAAEEGRARSAAEAWLWAAAAYQAASFRAHFEGGKRISRAMLRCRRLARAAYARAMKATPGLAEAVDLEAGPLRVRGYFRAPAARRAPVVVLLNGLDSVCEVEMHAFSEWMLARGIATLSVDLPAGFGSLARQPSFESERLADALVRWIDARRAAASGAIGAFGVSFGGYLAARMIAGATPLRCAAAVSPPAHLGGDELGIDRIRRMFAAAFDVDGPALEELAATMPIGTLAAPRAPLLHLHMRGDQVFGEPHADAYRRWGGALLQSATVDGEHVGTSVHHLWLPRVCDWLRDRLSD